MKFDLLDTDHTKRQDAFGRAAFAERLAQALVRTSSDDAIIVGLEGEWGSGKTHLLGQVRAKLQKAHPKAIIVEFNPWLVANAESLVLALLGQFAARIGTAAGNSRSAQAQQGLAASRRLLGYLSALQRVAEPTLLLFDPTGTASGLAAAARKPLDTMSKAIDDVSLPNRLSKADVFARKEAVVEALQKLDQPIVVIVDDLDRLEDDELRSVFQAIKAVADFPGTSYLLAYAPKRVAKAFSDESFVEKIVQVAYPIPHLHAWDMTLFAKNEIETTLSALGCNATQPNPKFFDEAMRLAASLCRHPRDVVRLCNRLRIAIPAVMASILPGDIVVAEAIALTCQPIADAMRRHPTDFTFLPHPRDDKEAEDEWVRYFSEELSRESNVPPWQKHIPDDATNRKALTKALGFLFGHEPKMGGDPIPAADRRLRDPALLAEYVQLNPVKGVPSPAAIDDMRSSPELLAAAIEETGDDAIELLGWIAKYPPTRPLPNSFIVLDQFILLGNRAGLQNPNRANDLLGTIAVQLIETSSALDRPRLMNQLIADASLSMSMTAVVEMAKEHGLINLSHRDEDTLLAQERFISDSKAAADIIKQWRDKVRQAAMAGMLTNEPRLHNLLHRWQQLGEPAYTELWQLTRTLCETDDGLESFVRDLADGVEDWKWASAFPSLLHLVWDCNDLIARLEKAEFAERFTQLRSHLGSNGAADRHAALRMIGKTDTETRPTS